MTVLQLTLVTGLLVCGMCVALLGSLKVTLARRLAMDEVRVGGLVSMFGFAMIPVMLVMGFLTDLLDKQLVVAGGALLIAASLLVLARARSYGAALLAVLLLSAGWSGLVNVLNVVMQQGFGGSATYAMNLGNFFFGLGAFLTPIVVPFLLRKLAFTPALLVVAAAAVVPGVFVFGVDFAALAPAPAAGAPAAGPGLEVLLTDPIMWLTALALLFYAPMEATLSAWTTTYLGDKKASETLSALMLSGFWLAFMLARLGTALIVNANPLAPGATNALIIGLAVFCTLVWAGIVFAPNRGLACLMVVLAGAAFGPTFPTVIGVLTGHVHPAVTGRAVGLFFMVGGIGWSLIPIMIGAYARKSGVQKAFLIAMGCAAGLALTGAALRPFMG
jgi:fucose permease